MAACFAVAILQGCAMLEGKPLKSAWYLQTSDDDAVVEIEVVLVNRSSRTVRVEQVFLNPNVEDKSKTWTREVPFQLESGKLVVLRTRDFTRTTPASTPAANDAAKSFTQLCLIPVSLSVAVGADTRSWLERMYGRMLGDDEGRIEVELAGRLPSSLPEDRQWPCRKTSIVMPK